MKSHGWSAVSYADLAKRVGIRTASIHHHFPTKADLGRVLVRRYSAGFQGQLSDIRSVGDDPAQHLRAYSGLVREAMGDGSGMCLCARFAADYQNLPDPMRILVAEFNEMNIDWLAGVLRDGVEQKVFHPIDDIGGEAESIFSEFQGAQLLACSSVDVTRFDAVAGRLMLRITAVQEAKT